MPRATEFNLTSKLNIASALRAILAEPRVLPLVLILVVLILLGIEPGAGAV